MSRGQGVEQRREREEWRDPWGAAVTVILEGGEDEGQ